METKFLALDKQQVVLSVLDKMEMQLLECKLLHKVSALALVVRQAHK